MHHAGNRTAATEDVAILLDVGTAVYGEVIPDQPSRTATRSRSCKASIGDPHGTHQREHGRLWRGHSRPAQPHGNSISIVHKVHRRSARHSPAGTRSSVARPFPTSPAARQLRSRSGIGFHRRPARANCVAVAASVAASSVTRGRLWRGPFPTRRSTFQAPQNGRRGSRSHPVNPIEWVTKSASSVTNSVTTGITQATGPPPRRTSRPFWTSARPSGEGHSRPAQPHSRPSTAAGENAPRQDITLIHLRCWRTSCSKKIAGSLTFYWVSARGGPRSSA